MILTRVVSFYRELSALRAPIAEINRHFDEGKDVQELDLHAIENATDIFNEVSQHNFISINHLCTLPDSTSNYYLCISIDVSLKVLL